MARARTMRRQERGEGEAQPAGQRSPPCAPCLQTAAAAQQQHRSSRAAASQAPAPVPHHEERFKAVLVQAAPVLARQRHLRQRQHRAQHQCKPQHALGRHHRQRAEPQVLRGRLGVVKESAPRAGPTAGARGMRWPSFLRGGTPAACYAAASRRRAVPRARMKWSSTTIWDAWMHSLTSVSAMPARKGPRRVPPCAARRGRGQAAAITAAACEHGGSPHQRWRMPGAPAATCFACTSAAGAAWCAHRPATPTSTMPGGGGGERGEAGGEGVGRRRRQAWKRAVPVQAGW